MTTESASRKHAQVSVHLLDAIEKKLNEMDNMPLGMAMKPGDFRNAAAAVHHLAESYAQLAAAQSDDPPDNEDG